MTNMQHAASAWKLPFPKTRWALIGFVAGVFTWSFAGGGHHRQAPETIVGDEAEAPLVSPDSTFTKVYQGVEDATTSVRDRISEVRSSAHHMSLGAKVKDRLAHEKSIDDDRIEIEVKDEGTVVLTGQVPSVSAKETAVDIARLTQGVLRVEDHLSVPPTMRVFALKTDADAASQQPRRTR
jgi:hypothetical protein